MAGDGATPGRHRRRAEPPSYAGGGFCSFSFSFSFGFGFSLAGWGAAFLWPSAWACGGGVRADPVAVPVVRRPALVAASPEALPCPPAGVPEAPAAPAGG